MNSLIHNNDRRDFIKKISLSTLPFLMPSIRLNEIPLQDNTFVEHKKPKTAVNFIYDGLAFSPQEYLKKLNEINDAQPIQPDYYGNGGATKALEDEFAKLTGKEKAIYLPSGTMANQLAIKLLNGDNTKVMVPENSHVFRDEADAAQSVHNKRLIPVGKGKPHFDLIDLKEAIEYANHSEVFKSGLGTVVIENPVRRADGAFIPIESIKEISNYCKENGYNLHLDGARIHIASAFSKISVAEYASYFNTVYISLYKYLNATGGAMLCGDASIINQVGHLIKIHGGTVFQSWNNTSMALHYLNSIDQRWQKVVENTNTLISALNKIEGLTITRLKNGTNIHALELADKIKLKDLAVYLYNEHNIWLGRPNAKGIVNLAVNESLLTRNVGDIIDAWKMGVDKARG